MRRNFQSTWHERDPSCEKSLAGGVEPPAFVRCRKVPYIGGRGRKVSVANVLRLATTSQCSMICAGDGITYCIYTKFFVSVTSFFIYR